MSSPSKLIKNFLLQLLFVKNILVIYRSLPVKHVASLANDKEISALGLGLHHLTEYCLILLANHATIVLDEIKTVKARCLKRLAPGQNL